MLRYNNDVAAFSFGRLFPNRSELWGAVHFFWRASSIARILCLASALAPAILPCNVAIGEDAPAKQPDKPPVAALPPIVCLHTEYMPLKQDEALKYRLMRELGRQALLIAARDELGLSTRDETLGEVFPDSVTQAKHDLFVTVRSQYNGNVRLQLWLASKPEELLPTKKEKQYDSKVILSQTEKLEPKIRGELRDQLRSLGFDGKIKPANEKNLPPDSVEGQLLEMNFVSQFAAVRAAHTAIAEKGHSRVWLGVLARGYANLALMTEHHWKSDTEVFAARALLYAERLATANADDSLAHCNRAYARAIVGLHGAALDELKRIDELRKRHPEQPTLPGWFELIEPYCSFDREPVIAIGERRPSLRQLAQRLSFEQNRAFGDDRWLFDSAKQSMTICPEEYGIYAALTRGSGSLLSVVRTGAYYAPPRLLIFSRPESLRFPICLRPSSTLPTDFHISRMIKRKAPMKNPKLRTRSLLPPRNHSASTQPLRPPSSRLYEYPHVTTKTKANRAGPLSASSFSKNSLCKLPTISASL